jgi:glycosyltransferase involved in cell wall biosynthesis
MRDLYAASRFLVMPLYPVDFQASVTAILEAMAMELPVICSQTPGQTDVVISGQTGLYVPPSDPLALKTAIQELLSQSDLSDQLGHSGRIHVLNEMSLDCYVERLNRFVQQASSYNLSADFVANSKLTNTNNP